MRKSRNQHVVEKEERNRLVGLFLYLIEPFHPNLACVKVGRASCPKSNPHEVTDSARKTSSIIPQESNTNEDKGMPFSPCKPKSQYDMSLSTETKQMLCGASKKSKSEASIINEGM